MGRRIFNLILVLLLVAVAAFFAAPWFAFRALRADARDGDAQGLAELVDYNSVRGSLKAQIADTPPPAAPAPSLWTDPLGALRHAMEPLRPPPPAVDTYVSAQGLHDLTRGYAPGEGPPEPPPPEGFIDQAKAAIDARWPRTQFWDPNRMRFAVRHPKDEGQETVFTFQRKDWFEWKLVDIKLPSKTKADAKAEPEKGS